MTAGDLLSERLVAWLLALPCAMGVVHLAVMLRRRPFPLVGFCTVSSAASVVIGLLLVAPAIRAQAGESLATAILWWPLFGLGFLAAGVVLALAWVAIVKGLAALLGRGRPPPAAARSKPDRGRRGP